jgi:steroid Delta-isomerase
MPSHAEMEAAVHTYVRGFATSHAEPIIDLFAENAVIEDPLGTPAMVGKEAVRAFYTRIMADGGARLELLGPVRTAASSAAFVFASFLTREGVNSRIDVVDVWDFDEAGKITNMRAYWGPENVTDL